MSNNSFTFSTDSKRVILKYDRDEAKGEVGLEYDGVYGPYLYIEGFDDPVALVDLFYLSKDSTEIEQKEDREKEKVPQIVIFDTNKEGAGEPICGIRFYPDGPRVWFENDIEILGYHKVYGKMFGRRKRDEI